MSQNERYAILIWQAIPPEFRPGARIRIITREDSPGEVEIIIADLPGPVGENLMRMLGSPDYTPVCDYVRVTVL